MEAYINHPFVNPPNTLHAINTLVSILVFVGGCLNLAAGIFKTFIIGIYMIIFALLILVTDIKLIKQMDWVFPFLFTSYGRAFTYWFLTWLVLERAGYGLVAGIFIMIFAVITTIMAYLDFEYPEPLVGEIEASGEKEDV